MTERESPDILGRERDQVFAGDGAREMDLRPKLDADSVEDVDCCCGETTV